MKENLASAIARYDSLNAAQLGGQTFGAWFPARPAATESAPDLLESLRAKISKLEAQIAATLVLPSDQLAAPDPIWRAMRFGPMNPMRIGLIARMT